MSNRSAVQGEVTRCDHKHLTRVRTEEGMMGSCMTCATVVPLADSPVSVQRAEIARTEQLAERFHEAYERLAPQFSYTTRKTSAVPWKDVPENNKRLMIAVCAEIIETSAVELRAGSLTEMFNEGYQKGLAASPSESAGTSVQRAEIARDEIRELLCQKCHRDYTVWFTDNHLWNRHADGRFHFLCLDCFAILAESSGEIPTAWYLTTEKRSASPSESDRTAYLESALRLISEGRGRFSRDDLTHASNTIEDMKKVAVDALAGTWEVPE